MFSQLFHSTSRHSSILPRPSRALAAAFALPMALAVVCGLPRAASAGTTAPPADAPLATIDGQTIFQKNVTDLLAQDYQEAALKRLIRKTLIDDLAAHAGITVTDADADRTVAKWKVDVLGGDESRYQVELGRQGLTPSLYREVVREGMIADLLVAKPTKLVDVDYDQQRVQPLYVKSLEDALQVYAALQGGENLVSVMKRYSITLQPMFTVYRYDARFDRNELNNIWGGDRPDHLAPEIGSFSKPIPAPNAVGYDILQIKEQIPGASMAQADRDTFGPGLLRQKTALRMQDWWAAVEKQVNTIYAAAGTGKAIVSAAPASVSGSPTAAAPAPGSDGGTLSIKLLPPAAH